MVRRSLLPALLMLTALSAQAAEPTAEQVKSLKDQATVLKSWADLMAPQFGESHPAVGFMRERIKQIDAALAAKKLPPDVPAPRPPADAVAKGELEDELEIHLQWIDGMEAGYGKDHPAITLVRARIKAIEAALGKKP